MQAVCLLSVLCAFAELPAHGGSYVPPRPTPPGGHYGGAQTGSDDFYLGMTREVAHRDHLRPTAKDIDDDVLPVLVEVLQAANTRDEITAAMVALAKAGREPRSVSRRTLFAARLREHDQEVRKTAALCAGIGRMHAPEDLRLLLDLALDTPDGRRACGRAAVDERTRAFAVYGLGLLPPVLSTHERSRVAEQLHPLLTSSASSRNVKVADALALAQFAGGSGPAERLLATDLVAWLGSYWSADRGAGEQLIQAHAATGVASVLSTTTWPPAPGATAWRRCSAPRRNAATRSIPCSRAPWRCRGWPRPDQGTTRRLRPSAGVSSPHTEATATSRRAGSQRSGSASSAATRRARRC
jgi:hypothetical protein